MTDDARNLNESIRDDENNVCTFSRRQLFWEYFTKKYRITDHFINLKSEIDEYLDNLFNGSIDAGNADVLDNIIMDVTRNALRELDKQRTSHINSITSLGIRSISDQKIFCDQLELYKKNLAVNKECQEKYKELSVRNEFL